MAGPASPGRKLPSISFGNSAYNRLLHDGREGTGGDPLPAARGDRTQLEIKQRRDSISQFDGFEDV